MGNVSGISLSVSGWTFVVDPPRGARFREGY
jgi:hypothetical protein